MFTQKLGDSFFKETKNLVLYPRSKNYVGENCIYCLESYRNHFQWLDKLRFTRLSQESGYGLTSIKF